MKTAVLACTTLTLATASLLPARAGDREWATAGKVLTGVVAAGVVVDALRPHYYQPGVVYRTPPATVVYAPAPPVAVTYYPAPVTQVFVAPPPVCVGRAPFHYGRPYHHFGVGWR